MPDDLDPHEKAVDRMVNRNKEEFYDLFDAAVDRWLDKQFSRFGKWAIGGALAALFVWGIKIYAAMGGFPK